MSKNKIQEFEPLYHGTKFKYNADKILKTGFKELSYFSTDLWTAMAQGGKYVFVVVFIKNQLPNYWQVRCENKIPTSRIVSLNRYKEMEIHLNKKLQKQVFNNALEFSKRKPYYFKEQNPNFL